MLKEEVNVTGKVETIDPTQTIETALRIEPSLKNIYLLSDTSESGMSTAKLVIEKTNEMYPHLNVFQFRYMPHQMIFDKVQELNEDSIILMGSYLMDINEVVMEPEFVAKKVSEKSSVPVYSLYEFNLNQGILGGSMLCGKNEGKIAALLAERVLKGEDINRIPIIDSATLQTVFDYQQLQRYHISTKLLPKDSVIINKPFSFYETYKPLVNSVIVVFFILLVLSAYSFYT